MYTRTATREGLWLAAGGCGPHGLLPSHSTTPKCLSTLGGRRGPEGRKEEMQGVGKERGTCSSTATLESLWLAAGAGCGPHDLQVSTFSALFFSFFFFFFLFFFCFIVVVFLFFLFFFFIFVVFFFFSFLFLSHLCCSAALVCFLVASW